MSVGREKDRQSYVSGLQDAGKPASCKPDTLELLMMGIVVPETC